MTQGLRRLREASHRILLDELLFIGLKVRMKINQEEYEPWTETAAMMVFIHNRLDYIFSESIRYNAELNNEVKLFPYGVN